MIDSVTYAHVLGVPINYVAIRPMIDNVTVALCVTLLPFVGRLRGREGLLEWLHAASGVSIVGCFLGVGLMHLGAAVFSGTFFYDKLISGVFALAAMNLILGMYISKSIEFRSEEQARALQNVFDQGSGEGGWYFGTKTNARNLLTTTKHYNPFFD